MNNGPQVLRGNTGATNTTNWSNNSSGLGHGQPQQQQAQQQQASPIARLVQYANGLQGRINQPGSNGSLYGNSGSRNNFAHLFALDDQMAEEQLKGQALADAGAIASNIVTICLNRNVNNPIYKTFRAAMEKFKTPRGLGAPEPSLCSFIDEIDNNTILFQSVTVNSVIQLSAMIADGLMKGDGRLSSDINVIQETFYRATLDTIYMHFFDFLGTTEQGVQIFYRLPTIVKEALTNLENPLFDMVSGRFIFVSAQCPWRKGRIGELQQRSQTENPLFNSFNQADNGFGGGYVNPNDSYFTQPQNNQQVDHRDIAEFLNRQHMLNQQAAMENPKPIYRNQEEAIPQTLYNDYDAPSLNLEDMTRENRLKFPLEKWGTVIPGTEWWLMRPEHAVHYGRVLKMDDGIPFRMRDTRCVGTVAVYRFNWMEGTFNFRLIKHNLQAFDLMGTLISNPSKLLPFMYEDNGVQKTTFDPVVMTTDKFINDGKVVHVGEMKQLEKEPEILVGSKPMKANQNNEHTVNRLEVYTQTYDPKSKLDAFVLPMVITREWQMEPEVNMNKFYDNFSVMVHNNKHDMDDAAQVFRIIRGAHNECDSEEFKDFVKPYLTNLVNRWLIECRGYAETKQEVDESPTPMSYLRSSDIFEDLEDFVEALRNDDPASLNAFMDYRFNTFIRTGVEVLCSREEVKEEFIERYGKDDDEVMRPVLIALGDKAIIIRRDTVFFNILKTPGPRTLDLVTIKESTNPELFAIIRKAFKVTDRHFKNTPQILIRFKSDEGGKVWVATPSEIDPGNVYNLRSVSAGQMYCHPYPICE